MTARVIRQIIGDGGVLGRPGVPKARIDNSRQIADAIITYIRFVTVSIIPRGMAGNVGNGMSDDVGFATCRLKRDFILQRV